MLRKVLFGLLTALLALSLVGCGGNKGGDAGKKDDKAAEVKVEGTADKAVLAYAQLQAYGTPDEDAIKATGLTPKEVEDIQAQVREGSMLSFANYSLSKENLDAISNQYAENLKVKTNVKATIKKDDAENPVVELTATTLKNDATENPDLTTLNKALEELKAQGLTDEQLVASADYQAFAIDSLKKVIDGIQFNEAASVEVPCVIVDKDGKKYWAPKDAAVIENFIWSKK